MNKNDIINNAHQTQGYSSKKRNHPQPDYTVGELTEWCLSQPNWDSIWSNYVKSDRDRMLAPSIDRIKDSPNQEKPYYINMTDIEWDEHPHHYCFENITLMTWEQNNTKSHLQRSKAVIIYSAKTGLQINSFISMSEAGRYYNVSNSSMINSCCKRVINTFKDGKYTARFFNPLTYNSKDTVVVPISYRKRVVMCIKNSDTFIQSFDTVTDASMYVDKNIGKITLVCQGKRNSAYGYNWWYEEEYLTEYPDMEDIT